MGADQVETCALIIGIIGLYLKCLRCELIKLKLPGTWDLWSSIDQTWSLSNNIDQKRRSFAIVLP